MSLRNSYTEHQNAMLENITEFARHLHPGDEAASDAAIGRIIALYRSAPSSISLWIPGMVWACLGVSDVRQALVQQGSQGRPACARLSHRLRECAIGIRQSHGLSPGETIILMGITMLMEDDPRAECLQRLMDHSQQGSHGISDMHRNVLIRMALRRPQHAMVAPAIRWLRTTAGGGLAAIIMSRAGNEISLIENGAHVACDDDRLVGAPPAFLSPATAPGAIANSALRLMALAADRTSGPDFLAGKRTEVPARIRSLARIMVRADDESLCAALRHLLPAITLAHGRLIKVAVQAGIPLADRLAQLMASGLLAPNEVASRHPALESARMAIRLGSGAMSAIAVPQRDRQRIRVMI